MIVVFILNFEGLNHDDSIVAALSALAKHVLEKSTYPLGIKKSAVITKNRMFTLD